MNVGPLLELISIGRPKQENVFDSKKEIIFSSCACLRRTVSIHFVK
jgi:hypothetical protein